LGLEALEVLVDLAVLAGQSALEGPFDHPVQAVPEALAVPVALVVLVDPVVPVAPSVPVVRPVLAGPAGLVAQRVLGGLEALWLPCLLSIPVVQLLPVALVVQLCR